MDYREYAPPPELADRVKVAWTLEGSSETLADHAAARGFADQARMTREFRKLPGEPAVAAKKRAVGPFLKGVNVQGRTDQSAN